MGVLVLARCQYKRCKLLQLKHQQPHKARSLLHRLVILTRPKVLCCAINYITFLQILQLKIVLPHQLILPNYYRLLHLDAT